MRILKVILLMLTLAFLLNEPCQAIDKKKQSAPKKTPTLKNLQENVHARAVLLIDYSTGKILFSKNPSNHYPPASIVKLLTALLVYERTGLRGNVTITSEDTKVEPSHVPLRTGETLSVSDLVNTLLIGSDNDSAMALAHHTGGSISHFVQMMNERAQQLGCTDSHFTNPHGLPDSKQYTSAHDMLLIFKQTLAIPALREIMQKQTFSLHTKIGSQTIKNHNKLLGKYPGMGPAKTGWTYASKHTYAALASQKKRDLVLILLNSSNKWEDACILFDYGFAQLSDSQVVEKDSSSSEATTSVSTEAAKPSTAPTSEEISSLPTKKPSTFILPVNHSGVASTNSKMTPYTVCPGDSLTNISKRFGCTVQDLMEHNHIADVKKIQPGQVLFVPQEEARSRDM